MPTSNIRLLGAATFIVGLTTLASSACAQVSIGVAGPSDSGVAVCVLGTDIVVVSGDDCNGSTTQGVTYVGSTGVYFGDLTAPTALLDNGEAYFQYYTEFNGQTVFNGDTSFNGPLNLAGDFTAAGITSTNGFTNTGGFRNNGGGTFTGAVTASSINAGGGNFAGPLVSSQLTTGAINASTLFTTAGATVSGFFTANNGASILGTTQLQTARVSQNLTVLNGATVTMGGNRVQNVGGPVDATDAANKDYVDSAVARTNVVNARQDQELSDVRTSNARQDQELNDVRAVNAQQAGQISAAETTNTRQDVELAQVRSVNSPQADQISALQALDAQQGQQIAALQVGQAALLGMIDETRRDLDETNEGVAMGLALESPALPPGANFALSGGFGYFNDRSAVTTAITTRISPNASFSAGIGVGLNSGKVGARGGFQIAW